jgi:hypothetical protein
MGERREVPIRDDPWRLTMPAAKRNAWLLTIAFAAVFGLTAWPMAKRIEAFNQAQHFRHFHVEPVKMRQVRLAGFPALRLEDSADDSGRFALKLTYGDPDAAAAAAPARTLFIPVLKPPVLNTSDLGIYDEWLRVLAINEVIRDPSGAQSVKAKSERLLIVVRRTPEGFDAAAWGSVRRTEWLFDFYDLQPDGTIASQTFRWPMSSDRREQAFQERAVAAARGDDSHPPDDRLAKLAAIPPLQERSVEYLAALHVIPKLNVPKYKFTDTALSPRVLGWTLPVVMLSGLGLSLSFFFAVAPTRVAPAQPGDQPAA